MDKRKCKGAKGGGGAQQSDWKTCTCCWKEHTGNPPEALCFQKDWEAEVKHAAMMQCKKKEYEKRQKDNKERDLKAKVGFYCRSQ